MSSTTFSAFVVCGFLCLCLTQSTNSQKIDSLCLMKSGAQGICKPSIQDCSDLWAVQKEGITKCGPGSNMMCCPITKSVDSPCLLQSGAAGVCKASVHDCDIHETVQGGTTSCGTGPEGNKMICCPNKTSISSRKCKEYREKKCINIKPRIGITSIIYKGEKVGSVEEFPHMALLGYDTGRKVEWVCGGTLISEQFVLTAAHCSTHNRAPVSRVNLGFLQRNNRNVDTLQEFQVIDTIRHPNRTGRVLYNDALLLKLDRPVNLTEAVFPACLHEDADISTNKVQAVGWGITEDSQLSEEMRKAYLKLVSNSECASDYADDRKLPNGIIEESQFCAGTNNKDTCQGDSGGPALIRHSNGCMNSVVGITSFGIQCDFNNGTSPTVFTRVSHIIPWIESVVWPNE